MHASIDAWVHGVYYASSRETTFAQRFIGLSFIPLALLAGWSALYYAINFFLTVERQADRLERLEAQATAAQLAMLRYQLNPHFLFNTLNSISTLVLLKQTEPANAMLTRLSGFLRHTLIAEPGSQVTLAQEIETLQLYLDIERMRFEERLRTHFEIDDAALGAQLPSMLLQPLVENAIKYAVSPQEEGARISLTARVIGDRLRLTVEDTGPGLDEPLLFDRIDAAASRAEMRAGHAPGRPVSTGVGLANIRNRLMQAYGDAHLFETRSEPGGGFTVLIEIPYSRASEPEFQVPAAPAPKGDAAPAGAKVIPLSPATNLRNIRMTIRTILVDDEKLAIQGLQLRLQPFDDVEIIDTCANGREAIRKIKTEKPDLVFLDIQMPGFDGFSVVKGVMDIEPPLFVFVTAYEEHAIRAFEANAVNYLMKPVDEQKLADTIERVRQRLAEKKSAEDAEQLLDVLNEIAPDRAADFAETTTVVAESAERFEKLINVKDRGQIFRVEVDSIEHIEAAGDYMIISTGDNSLVLRETMKDLERRLDPRKFQRVHRSTIVNLDLVRQVRPHTNGECFLVLESGAEVKVSRSYRDVVARFVHYVGRRQLRARVLGAVPPLRSGRLRAASRPCGACGSVYGGSYDRVFPPRLRPCQIHPAKPWPKTSVTACRAAGVM